MLANSGKKQKVAVVILFIFLMPLFLESCCTVRKTKKQDIDQVKGIFAVLILTEGVSPRGRYIWLYDNAILRTNPGCPPKDYIAKLSASEYKRLLELFESVNYQKEKEELISTYGEGCVECKRIVIFDAKEKMVSIPLDKIMPPPAIQKFLKAVVKTCQVKFGKKFSLPNDFKEMFKDDVK